MLKNLPISLAAVLILFAPSSFGQAPDKADYFGQPAAEERRVWEKEHVEPINRRAITNPGVTKGVRDQNVDVERGLDSPLSQQRARRESSGVTQREGVASEFQKFILDSTGEKLPIFGADFFASSPVTFAPGGDEPVPADYTLGAGDELLIRGWGTIDIDLRAKIDRNGLIAIPTVGSVVLAGVKAGDAESVIRGAVARLYKGVTVNVTFGQLRAITVYVVGQASRPGTYTMSSLSTLVTAVFASGGPNANGSLRRLQVKRSGQVVAELDLYAFIGKGDKTGDIKLRDGDTIFIPQASGVVALMGKVNTPAIYELRGGQDSVASLLDFAGGMPVVADPRRAFLERIDAGKNQPRSVEQFALTGEGLKRSMKNGDVLNVTSITPDFSNAVVLRGNVDQPVRVPFTPGMRVSDLIPSRDYLITRRSTLHRNSALQTATKGRVQPPTGSSMGRATDKYSDSKNPIGDPDRVEPTPSDGDETPAWRIGKTVDEINWDYAVIERVNRVDLSTLLIPFNLGRVFTTPAGPDNVQLEAGDTVTIFSQSDVAVPVDRRRVFVRVEGEVNAPGIYQMASGDTLQALLGRAGGPTGNAYLFGTALYREQVRKEQQVNLEKAANRLENQFRNAQSRATANTRALTAVDAQVAESERLAELQNAKESIARFRQLKPTGRIAFGLSPSEKRFAALPQIKLEDGDRLVIPAQPDFVHVFGAVNSEASPLWKSNGRVGDYLKLVGLNAEADLDGVVIMRVDGSVVSRDSQSWLFGRITNAIVMPGDSIVVPEKFDKETAWSKFTRGTREWAQIFANFGLGAAAIKVLK